MSFAEKYMFFPGSIPCDICYKIFKSSMGLSNHYRTYHNSTMPKQFVCGICNKIVAIPDMHSRYHLII